MIQLQVLNKILDTKDFSFVLENNITEDYFSEYTEQFNFVKNHFNKYGNVPDKETFFNQFPDVDNIVVDEGYQYLLDALCDDKNIRTIANVSVDVQNKVIAGKAKDAITLYKNAADVLSSSAPIKAVSFKENARDRLNEYLDRRNNFGKHYITTGFPELDELIGGWDMREEYVTIVARTNQGKTWILQKCAQAAMNAGLRVGIYSGEMTVFKFSSRLDTYFSHISNKSIIRGDTSIQNDYQRYIEDLEKSNIDAFIITPKELGGLATISQLRSFIDKYELDILFIDQHSLLEDERKGRTPVEKASNISKDLKNLQVMSQIPIITVSQQNRSKTDETYGAGTENIAQSDRIGQDSTIVIFFEQDKEQQILTMTLVKTRDSEHMKKLKYAFDFDKGVFTYIPDKQSEDDTVDDERIKQLEKDYDIQMQRDTDMNCF